MKCMTCENFSLTHICSACQTTFLTPSIYKRSLSNGVEVFSFYKYEDIKELLFTKHTDLGFYVYDILAKLSFAKFAQEFDFGTSAVSIPIDDNVKNGYSHAAVLNRRLKSKNVKPLYNKLRAKNEISYSGKSKAFRLANARDFELKEFEGENVILVDDVVTTGATLIEASNLLARRKKEVLFCLTLTDVSQK
jgi:competence protein ComFC